MTVLVATLHAAAHAAAAATAAALMAEPLAGLLRTSRGRLRAAAWLMLLLPLLVPALFVGYAYWPVSLSLVRQPWLNELLYAALITARFVPVAALVAYLSPPPALSAEAQHCAALLPGRSRVVGTRAWLMYGKGRRLAVAAGVVFLLAFQEFEVASLMGVTTWTVWLFDAQAGGLDLALTLRYAAIPVGVQMAVLAPLAVLLLTRTRAATPSEPRPAGRVATVIAWCWLSLGVLGVGLYPLLGIAWEVTGDAGVFSAAAGIAPQVRVSLAYAAIATGLVLALMAATAWAPSVRLVAAVPGLMGSLVLALVVLGVFQHKSLHGAYDTAAPWLLTLLLLLMPLCVLLSLVIAAVRRAEALHLSGIMRRDERPPVRHAGWRIGWALRGRAWFWGAALLMFTAYFDLAAGALLAPSGDVPVTVTLYNLMHYGHNAVLSAMTLVAIVSLLLTLLATRGALGAFFAFPGLRGRGDVPAVAMGGGGD